jgi:hypothetical protein
MHIERSYILNEVPDAAADANLKYDIFGEYATRGEVRQFKGIAETPELPGVSGGSLMQYVPLQIETGLWSASKTLKFVGVQSSASDMRKWFRAKNWHAIAHAFEKHDPELAALIQTQLDVV